MSAEDETPEVEPEAAPVAEAEPEVPAEVEPEETPADDPTAKARKEAARYRRELRAEQAVTAALRERVEASDQAEVERAAKAAGLLPESVPDLWGRVELAELRGEDGTLDSDRVDAALKALKADRGHWFEFHGAIPMDGGFRNGPPPPPPTFGEMVRGKVLGS